MSELIAIAAIAFAAGVGFTILFARWLLWNDVVIETAAHRVDDDDDWGDDADTQRAEAELAEYRRDPSSAISWDEAKAILREGGQ